MLRGFQCISLLSPREREGARALMREREAEAEGKVRGLAAQRSQVESKQRPLDHYAATGGAGRLEEVTQRLAGSRQRLQQKEDGLKVRVWSVELIRSH